MSENALSDELLKRAPVRLGKYSFVLASHSSDASHCQGKNGYKPNVGATCQNAGGRGAQRGNLRLTLFASKGHDVPNTPGRFIVHKAESYAPAVIKKSDTSIH